jgi:hypothetical protein
MIVHPLPAEHPQRVWLKRLLQHGKHGFFLAPEMFARGRQRPFEPVLRFRRIGRTLEVFELVVNFAMILMEAMQRPPVGEDVIQGRIGQIRFRFAMTVQQTLHHRRQQFHFRRGWGARQDPFDLIKHFAENGVFHDESFCDGFHVLIDGTCGHGVQIRRCDFSGARPRHLTTDTNNRAPVAPTCRVNLSRRSVTKTEAQRRREWNEGGGRAGTCDSAGLIPLLSTISGRFL